MTPALRIVILGVLLTFLVYRITPNSPPDKWEVMILLLVALVLEGIWQLIARGLGRRGRNSRKGKE